LVLVVQVEREAVVQDSRGKQIRGLEVAVQVAIQHGLLFLVKVVVQVNMLSYLFQIYQRVIHLQLVVVVQVELVQVRRAVLVGLE
jgi:uncharacterized membrane protein (UPF0127 family)